MNMNYAIKQLSDHVYVIQDKVLEYHNNATVIFTEEGPIIVDVFRDRSQFENIMEFIGTKGYEKPLGIVYTHWHADHICGIRDIENVPVYAHEATKRHMLDFIEKDLERLQGEGLLESDVRLVLPTETFEDKLILEFGHRTIELFHCPGHSHDSILVYEKDSGVLIAGDNLVGKEVAFIMPPAILPDEVDAKAEDLEGAYELIESLNANFVVPGHGDLFDSSELLELNKARYSECREKELRFIE